MPISNTTPTKTTFYDSSRLGITSHAMAIISKYVSRRDLGVSSSKYCGILVFKNIHHYSYASHENTCTIFRSLYSEGNMSSLFSLFLFASNAHAHGIWGHIHVTGWAIEYTKNPELQEFFSDPVVRNSALFGSAFTDSGYFPFVESIAQHSNIYSEYTHWEPYVEDYIKWMLQNDPPPFTSLASKKRVAFLMGTASHGLQDEIFDSLFIHWGEEKDGEGQETLDPACDGFLAREGELRFYPYEEIPLEPLIDIYSRLDPDITEQVIADSVAMMVGLYVNEDSGQNTARQLADLYGENLIWSEQHYLDPNIPGSIQSEIIPTSRYMEAIWKRLHNEFTSDDILIATFPEEHRYLNSTEADSVGSWSTLIFGAGVDAARIDASLRSWNGKLVSTSLKGTQWGAEWTRLVRILPEEDLKQNTQYIVNLRTIEAINGKSKEQIGFLFKTECTNPSSVQCLTTGTPDVASRTGEKPEETAKKTMGCSHNSQDSDLAWLLIGLGSILLWQRKTQQKT